MRTYNILDRLNDKLKELNIIHDGIVLNSSRGVPYLWLSKNKLNISVCHFKSKKLLKMWTGCGTPENKYYKTIKLWYDVPLAIDLLLKESK